VAGDWIKMDVGLPEKPEVWRIAGICHIDPDAVVGKLLKVWRWFDSHTEDGNALGVSYALVDFVSGVSGFAEAMALCGWLVQDGIILTLPNFDHHNGKTAKNRALTAKRVAFHGSKTNAVIVSDALAREEKRREDIKDIEMVASLPLKDNSEFGVSSVLVEEMKLAYPGVSVLDEIKKMRAWLISNPAKRKTFSGSPKFINSWLSRVVPVSIDQTSTVKRRKMLGEGSSTNYGGNE
jgi:hypothetical protein